MAQIQKRGIAANAVDEAKIRLSNAAALRGRNAAGTADVNIIKLDASDRPAFDSAPYVGSNKVVDESQKGSSLGVATLDSGGKIPLSQLPASLMEYQGTYDASTNTPALHDATGGLLPSGAQSGWFYRVQVAGTQNFGGGAQTFVVGDWVMYNGSVWQLAHAGADAVTSVNGLAGTVVLTTSNIAEGSNLYYTQARFDAAFSAKSTTNLTEGTNLYFTNARAIAAPLTGYVSGAGTVSATDSILQAIQKLNGNFAAYVAPVSSVNGQTGAVVLTTTNIAEGSNLYFTAARVLATAITGFVSGAGTVAATDTVLQAVNKLDGNTALKQNILVSGNEALTLNSTDITNQYKDLAVSIINGTLKFEVHGVLQIQGVDFSLSVVSNKTRVTFLGDLATGGQAALISGDVIYATYCS